MTKKLMILAIILGLAALMAAPALAQQGSSKCAWKVSALQLGKWGNGNKKAAIWPKGSFPIPAGVSERPDWYVNDHNCGKSQMCVGCVSTMRFLPNSSQYIKDGEANTITVKYSKPPCQGVSISKTVVVEWSQVPNGGYRTFK